MIDFQKYIISDTASIKDALITIKKLSNDVLTLFVIDKKGCMVGTVTDGDIRRKLVDGFTLDDNIVYAMNTAFNYVSDCKVQVTEIKKFKVANITLLPCLDNTKHIVRVYNLKKQ